ncbi:MAG: glycosyl hydrolase, partial [Stenotrophomonas sp.]|nr:glycosyl hydrolase [Stenotrophomonas sp.]
MKTISKPLALTAAIALSLSASAWAAAPAATTDAFTVLTLEQTPGELDAAVVAAQLEQLQVDALTVRNVERRADRVDPLQGLADALGYHYRFVTADPAAAQQTGSVVLTRLPIEAESGTEQPSLNYLRLNDGRHVVALYTSAADAAALPPLVTRSRLGAPAVLLGAVSADAATTAGFDPSRVALEANESYFSDGFQSASSAPIKLRTHDGRKGTTAATLLTLGYAAPVGGETPWMDTALNADARAKALVAQMTVDEKFQMLHSYFGLGKDGGPLPEGAVGSAGFVPGVPRLGI